MKNMEHIHMANVWCGFANQGSALGLSVSRVPRVGRETVKVKVILVLHVLQRAKKLNAM